MIPTVALELLHSFFGEPVRASYKAPHANQPTPPRRRKARMDELVFSKHHDTMIKKPKLFTGHCP